MTDTNPFFAPSTLPFGLPPFAEIRFDHYEPAFTAGMAEQRAEVAAILQGIDPPSIENTLVPLEKSGRLLARVSAAFFTASSTSSTAEISEPEQRLAPILAAHSDAIRLDPALYERIAAIQASVADRETADRDPETTRLVERYFIEFTQGGAGLDAEGKDRLRALNAELSSLTTLFEANLRVETRDLAVVVDEESELDGLTGSEIAAAQTAARDRGLETGYLLPLVLPTGHPALASLTRRDVRERLSTASRARGRRAGDHDNRPVVAHIARLRAERAALLGYHSHAAYITADQTAGTPEAVAELLNGVAGAAATNARREQAELEQLAGHAIEAWDWAFYSEKLRAERFSIDRGTLPAYFEAERVLRDGVFFAAERLYGLGFTERPDLVGYHPGSRVFEVQDADGNALGLYVLDLYARDSKRGGAWMTSLVSQASLLDIDAAVVTNNLNVGLSPAGEPTLLTFDQVVTLFHEFGHALHGLLAKVTYPKFAGTRVFRDVVEFPSQVNEMWMLWPEVLENFAVHHLTGERLPRATIDALLSSGQFNEGFATSEYLAAALLDQAWHSLRPDEIATAGLAATGDDLVNAVDEFEARALRAVGLDNPAVPSRYSSTYFSHVFAGGYAAAYYSYLWSEVLDADTVQWFIENGGLTRENGDRFRRFILSPGGSRDPRDAYREFRGRDAVVAPLLARRGLTETGPSGDPGPE